MKRSIDAGINMARAFSAKSRPDLSVIPAPEIAVPPVTEIASVPTPVPSLPWYRVVGRSALRALRPLAQPLLNRIDLRIRWALDRSNVAARLVEVERKFEATSQRLDTMEIGLDAMRMGVSSLSAAVSRMNATLMETGGSWLDQRMAERMQALDHQVAQRVEWLDHTNAQRLIPLQTAAEKLDARSDLLLQRNIIGLGQELAVRTVAGYLLAPVEDPAVLVGLVEGRGYLEPGTTAVLQTLLHPGDTMVDVGGHIGTLALPAARRVGAAGRVIALEPAPRLAALLRRTMMLNHIGWVDVHECAAGEAEAVAHFGLSARTSHNSLFPIDDTAQQIEVTVRPLDALIPSGTAVHVVKVDAEGAELQVWRGMQRILADNPALAVLLEFGPEHLVRVGVSVAEWFAEVTAHGHTPWEIDEQTGRVRPLRAAGLEDVYSFNVLLLRDAPTDRGLVLA